MKLLQDHCAVCSGEFGSVHCALYMVTHEKNTGCLQNCFWALVGSKLSSDSLA